MSTNRCRLEQLPNMSAGQIKDLPLDQIEMLLEDLADMKTKVRLYDELLHAEMQHRFAARAAAMRKAEGKDTGTVSVQECEYVIRADLPKNVKWDGAKLLDAADIVIGWGENPDDYIDRKLSVSETKYNAWPATIRKVFEPARTVGVGKQTFKMEKA